MNHGSLFSGIGGFDLAAQWMGWDNLFHCEWNEFGQKVLKYYWPKAISYDDITKTDFTIHRGQIDVLTGGFPCQPFSLAGKRKGTDDERHLWPEMRRAIREIAPKWIVGENVLGLVNWDGGLVFEQVQADLEAEGYEVQPYILPACGVNAPHRRDRVWFIAYNSNARTESMRSKRKNAIYGFKPSSDADSKPRKQEFKRNRKECGQEWEQIRGDITSISQIRTTTNPDSKRLQKCDNAGFSKRQERQSNKEIPSPKNWQNFPTQSPVCDGNDGLSSRLDGITFPKWRNESIKAGGNAIVPQVALQIFKAIEHYELMND